MVNIIAMTASTHWDPDSYRRNAGFVPELGAPVLNLLAPRPGERVLDLGCGEGLLTARLLDAGCEVVAMDSSPEQVAAARARGLDARVGDAARLTFDREFDAVFSNAALHWVTDHDALLEGVHAALRPGGRFVAEFGGHGNVATIRVALGAVLGRRGLDARALDPWYFPCAEEYRTRLETAGFELDSITLFARPTPLPTGVQGWLSTFAQPFFSALPEAERAAALEELLALTAPVLCDRFGRTSADYVRLRFAARRGG
jgi:trans-aconitate methyltransferase